MSKYIPISMCLLSLITLLYTLCISPLSVSGQTTNTNGINFADTVPYFPNGTFPRQDSVDRYQIAMWFSILGGCVLLATILAIANMEFKKDTMLYSSFNPNWEDRKRR